MYHYSRVPGAPEERWWCDDCTARGDLPLGDDSDAVQHTKDTGHNVRIERTRINRIVGYRSHTPATGR